MSYGATELKVMIGLSDNLLPANTNLLPLPMLTYFQLG